MPHGRGEDFQLVCTILLTTTSGAEPIRERSGAGTLDRTNDSEPSAASTAFDHQRDAAVALTLMSRSILVATSSEGSDQSWRQRSTCTSEGKDDEIRVRLCELLDL